MSADDVTAENLHLHVGGLVNEAKFVAEILEGAMPGEVSNRVIWEVALALMVIARIDRAFEEPQSAE